MKKAEEVGQINPEAAIEAARIDPSIDEGIVPFHQHKPFALEALHTCPVVLRLPKTIHDQCDASGEQATAHERRAKIHEHIGASRRLSPLPQISDPALHHQDGESQQGPNHEPPGKGSKRHRNTQ